MGVDVSRRALLRGHFARAPSRRPPWSCDDPIFTAHCTQCGDCLHACETGIIVRDEAGFPRVDFRHGECTFCQACVAVCDAPVFHDPEANLPWTQVAHIGPACLGPQGIHCRSCGESCEAGAIHFAFNAQRVPEPEIDTQACTGCGACVAVCPTQAITVGPAAPSRREEAP